MSEAATILKAVRRLRNADTELRRAIGAGDPERTNRAGTSYAIAKFRLFAAATDLREPIRKPRAALAQSDAQPFPQPQRKDGGEPCGECHLQPGETCDICGAKNDAPPQDVREALDEIPPDRQDRFEQITQEVVDRWYIDSGRPWLASSYKIKWPRYENAAAFENNARAMWEELGLHADDETCIAILAAALERAAALASAQQT